MNYSVDWDGPGEREPTTVACALPADAKLEDFTPFPGSDKAVAMGCRCPEQTRWPHRLTFSVDCPVHELERVPS